MLLNVANLATLNQAYNAAFKDAFARAEPDWQKIASEIPSTTDSNFYAFLGQFPRLREWLGERVVKSMKASRYIVPNKDFEATLEVDRNQILDDTYGIFTPLMAEMGYSAKLHPDEILFELLLAGATTECYDGQNFFDTDHPIVLVGGTESTASNYDASGGGNMWVIMDTRRPLKPLIFQKRQDYQFQTFTRMDDEHVFKTKKFLYGVDGRMAPAFGLWQLAYASLNTLNATNFDAAVLAMISLKSDEGKPLGIKPNLIVYGPSNKSAARGLFSLPLINGGETNPNFEEVELLLSPQMV